MRRAVDLEILDGLRAAWPAPIEVVDSTDSDLRLTVDGTAVRVGCEGAALLWVEINLVIVGRHYSRRASVANADEVVAWLISELFVSCDQCDTGIETDEALYAAYSLCDSCGARRFPPFKGDRNLLIAQRPTLEEAVGWWDAGFRDANVVLAVAEDLGFENFELASLASAQGIELDSELLVDLADNTPFGAHLPWIEAGFTLDELLCWWAGLWQTGDFTPQAAQRCVSAGIGHERAGAIGPYVLDWIDAGVTSALLLEWSADSSIPLEESDPVELRAAGVPFTADGLRRWGGLSSEDVLAAVDAGLNDGISIRDYPSGWWALSSSVGLTSDQAFVWNRARFDPAEVRHWISYGFEPRAAAEWRDRDMSPGDASEWQQSGFGPVEAFAWSQADVTPSVAAKRARAGLSAPQRS